MRLECQLSDTLSNCYLNHKVFCLPDRTGLAQWPNIQFCLLIIIPRYNSTGFDRSVVEKITCQDEGTSRKEKQLGKFDGFYLHVNKAKASLVENNMRSRIYKLAVFSVGYKCIRVLIEWEVGPCDSFFCSISRWDRLLHYTSRENACNLGSHWQNPVLKGPQTNCIFSMLWLDQRAAYWTFLLSKLHL